MNRRRLEMRIEERLVHRVAILDSSQRLTDTLAHPIRGFAGWSRQSNLRRIDAKAYHQPHDRDDDRRLTGTRTARDDSESLPCRSANDTALFIGHHDPLALHNHRTSNHILKRAGDSLRIRLLFWMSTQKRRESNSQFALAAIDTLMHYVRCNV